MASKTKTYSDVDMRLSIDVDGSPKINEGAEAIMQSIKMILSTAPGERVKLPEFGSSLREYLFEPLNQDNANEIAHEIETSLATFEPRIEVINVGVKVDDINELYDITVNFRYAGTGESDQFAGRVRAFNTG